VLELYLLDYQLNDEISLIPISLKFWDKW
jgi:hypothetical protein